MSLKKGKRVIPSEIFRIVEESHLLLFFITITESAVNYTSPSVISCVWQARLDPNADSQRGF